MSLRPPDDQDIVVVGASGDLSARKLLPALYNLDAEGLLPKQGVIAGYAQPELDDDAFRAHARESITTFSRTGIDDTVFARFAKRLIYVPVSAGMSGLRARLAQPTRLAYLAVPPSAFASLVQDFGAAELATGTSIVIEKPLGHDLASARELNLALHKVFDEAHILRIDHYLGKETVQNLLVFRFGNSIFERVWNRDCVERVEITVAEDIGVEHRGAFYEETGAIRDIVQNHLFQLLAVTAMEPPSSFEPEALRNEKVKVLNAVHPVDPARVVRGQYAAGSVGGVDVPGYREEAGVDPASTTETFAAMCIHIDSWRWGGVPFMLRTGKRLRRRETTVVLTFRPVPLRLFHGTRHSIEHNRLVVRVQPNEGIDLTMTAKRPGPAIETQTVAMDFSYGSSFKTSPPEAYERLLHDALHGDHTLFIREDEVERGWAIVDPILAAPPPITFYPAGTWGPPEADAVAVPGGWNSLDSLVPEGSGAGG